MMMHLCARLPERTEGDRRLVQATPARACERTAENAKCQAPRPLPVLRTIDELSQFVAVLPESPAYLAHVAESPHARHNHLRSGEFDINMLEGLSRSRHWAACITGMNVLPHN